ncbi:MAG: UvrD-helicase domain-containing protein [Alphaproteobacteria bacterium]
MTLPATTSPIPPAAEPEWLTSLNTAQRAAVEATEGPVLVLAGAGTGKTRTLTARLAYLLRTGKARPGEILAVTFTNKAAQEMTERVAALIGRPVENWWLGTFHALGVRILRRHAELVGLKPGFSILDTDDQVRLLKQVMEAEGIDDKKWPARVLAAIVQRWKDRGLGPENINVADAGDFAGGRSAALYMQYQNRLRILNAVDFGDLLLLCIKLFQRHPDILSEYQQRFRYLLVDEYQDTNVAQYLWLRLLAQNVQGGASHICCVGDDDQSIYGWRGAEVGNILRFERDFPGATVVRLEQNYRSTGHILGAAAGLISHNEDRLGKTLWSADALGEKVQILALWDGEEEARWVGDAIETLQRQEISLGDMAVLVRAGWQTREFEERFMTLGLPYRVIGGPRFYERQEIRDALAYLRVVAQPDDDLAFERIINVPRRGIGTATVQTLHTLGRATGCSLMTAAIQLCTTDELKPAARRALAKLIADFDRWRDLSRDMSHVELAGIILDESGYTAMWQADRSAEAPGRLENLKELVAALAEFENLNGFLEHVALVMENDGSTEGARVSIMTLHGAKGLEFDTVFLPGWEEGVFPNPRSLDENGAAGLEEERRLAYVGITRARRRLTILSVANRRIYGTWQSCIPSRFLDELPAEDIERSGSPGLSAGANRAVGVLREMRTGWQRAQLSSSSSGGYAPDDIYDEIATGDRIFHVKFGMGTVLATDMDRLTIAFDAAGEKTVVAGFVRKA